MAPIIRSRPWPEVQVPSSCTKNSVLIRRLASFSLSFRWVKSESISSINTTAGCLYPATANKVLTNFSPSPIHLLVSEELDIEKKVAPDSCAIAFPIKVLPVRNNSLYLLDKQKKKMRNSNKELNLKNKSNKVLIMHAN